jgi:hypothetical protein
MRRYLTLFILLLPWMLAGPSGCSGARISAQPPDWVLKGGGLPLEEERMFFYGVGSASGGSRSQARSAAEERAREDLAKVLERYSSQLLKDFIVPENGEALLRSVTATGLEGGTIEERWTDPNDGTVYALARLDLQTFKEKVGQAGGIHADIREHVRQNAERTFTEFSSSR